MRAWLRGVVPIAWRRAIALTRRAWLDRLNTAQFAQTKFTEVDIATWSGAHMITQPIHAAPFVNEKRANLKKAAAILNGIVIAPGEVFSFWHCVGAPRKKLGWEAGRTLINDRMTTDPGGGLCQMSGLIYHGGLVAGLTPVERHSHSQDIYKEEAYRFTPLGLDASVVYGFKDLRLYNPTKQSFSLWVIVAHDGISLTLRSPEVVPSLGLECIRVEEVGQRRVTVVRAWPEGRQEIISETLYRC